METAETNVSSGSTTAVAIMYIRCVDDGMQQQALFFFFFFLFFFFQVSTRHMTLLS